MANNTTLTPLVQADIDALNGTQTLAELIDLKIAAVRLGMATTAIDTRLDALDMSAADTATLMENAVANELVRGATSGELLTAESNIIGLLGKVKSRQYGVINISAYRDSTNYDTNGVKTGTLNISPVTNMLKTHIIVRHIINKENYTNYTSSRFDSATSNSLQYIKMKTVSQVEMSAGVYAPYTSGNSTSANIIAYIEIVEVE
jgi:hypothetical protein